MKTICVTRLFGLIYGLTSLSDISSDEFNTVTCIKYISIFCNAKLSGFPYWETTQDVFINIKIPEHKNIQKYIVKTLLKSKTFDITHLNNRNDNSIKCSYYFIQFANTIRQLLL